MSTLNVDVEHEGGYNYDRTGADLQTFSDKAVIREYNYSKYR